MEKILNISSYRKIKVPGKLIILTSVFLVFAVIYCLLSLVNHCLYRTGALDLGMFNHAIYSFSHLKMNYFTLDVWGNEINYFGDHFSPITILLSPFYYIFGSYTLLIIQVIFILWGGLGIYKYASLSHSRTYIPVLLTIQFFSIWGIYSALAFDFHNNVIAAMFVPWLFYFYEKANKKSFLLFFVLILISKENMALWMGFILIGLIVKRLMAEKGKIQVKELLKFEIPLIVISFLYFILIVGIVMPLIRHGQGSDQLGRYALLGSTMPEIFSKLFQNPKYVFSILFESPLKDGVGFGIKSELHFLILVSGGFALLYRPYYLVMLIPIYAQKLLTGDFFYWGINGQYSIEFVPILSLCLSDFLATRKSTKTAYGITIVTIISTLYFTFSSIEKNSGLWYDKTNSAFYSKIHYRSPLNISEINNTLTTLPDDAIISVSSVLSPHLAFRDKIYLFPVIKDATFIVLLTSNGGTYPLNETDFLKKVDELLKDDKYEVKYRKNDLLILKRKN